MGLTETEDIEVGAQQDPGTFLKHKAMSSLQWELTEL